MKIPIPITITPDNVEEWIANSDLLIHRASVKASQQLIHCGVDDDDEAVMFNFYEDPGFDYPIADLTLRKADVVEALTAAEKFFVEEELYEDAIICKNLMKYQVYKK